MLSRLGMEVNRGQFYEKKKKKAKLQAAISRGRENVAGRSWGPRKIRRVPLSRDCKCSLKEQEALLSWLWLLASSTSSTASALPGNITAASVFSALCLRAL